MQSKRGGLEFNITKEDLNVPAVCPVLGIPLEYGSENKHNSPSLDRFDNSKGYVKGNVRVISWRANNLKADGSLDEFRRLVSWMENATPT